MLHCIYIYLIFFIHSSIDGNIGLFHKLAIVNGAERNMDVQVSVLYGDLFSFKYIPKNDIAGS
jgi:hypothetical protein